MILLFFFLLIFLLTLGLNLYITFLYLQIFVYLLSPFLILFVSILTCWTYCTLKRTTFDERCQTSNEASSEKAFHRIHTPAWHFLTTPNMNVNNISFLEISCQQYYELFMLGCAIIGQVVATFACSFHPAERHKVKTVVLNRNQIIPEQKMQTIFFYIE